MYVCMYVCVYIYIYIYIVRPFSYLGFQGLGFGNGNPTVVLMTSRDHLIRDSSRLSIDNSGILSRTTPVYQQAILSIYQTSAKLANRISYDNLIKCVQRMQTSADIVYHKHV